MNASNNTYAKRRSIVSLVADSLCFKITKLIMERSFKKGMMKEQIVVPVRCLIGQRIIATGSFELTQFDSVRRLLSDPEVFIEKSININGLFIDVGANIGLYTLNFYSLFSSVIAIEANPTTFMILNSNIRLAGITNAIAMNVGASNASGFANLKVPNSGMLGGARFGDDAPRDATDVKTRIDTLDALVKEQGDGNRVAMIKIDVEGHELEVLEGARGVIERDGPIILYEALSEDAGKRCSKVLLDAGYTNFYTFRRNRSFKDIFFGAEVSAVEIAPLKPPRSALICAVRSKPTLP